MKRHATPLLMIGAYLVLVLLAFSSNWLDCSEYAAFSSTTCRDIHRRLGIDLYWVSVSSALLLFPASIFLVAPLLIWTLCRAMIARLRRGAGS